MYDFFSIKSVSLIHLPAFYDDDVFFLRLSADYNSAQDIGCGIKTEQRSYSN